MRHLGYTNAKKRSHTHTPTHPQGVVAATPMARKAAKDNGIDLASNKGSGNFGRVLEVTNGSQC